MSPVRSIHNSALGMSFEDFSSSPLQAQHLGVVDEIDML